MIGAVVLLLASGMYHINEPDKFTPSARWLITSGIRSKQNTTKKELRSDIYKAYLTLSNKDLFKPAIANKVLLYCLG
jgi:hypothetical protein